MTVEDIRKWYYAEPFQPFAVHTQDGGEFLVPDRMCIAISPLETEITVALPDSSFERIVVSSIDRLQAADVPKEEAGNK